MRVLTEHMNQVINNRGVPDLRCSRGTYQEVTDDKKLAF